ncbi:hypothetical protein HK102_004256 [Quaeritorhiza haematococci]|nr:hypothetical protein HK102_004256 [Quaeritorhiza haematococci]
MNPEENELLQKIYASMTPSGAVDSEALLNTLLAEGKALLWAGAEQQSKYGNRNTIITKQVTNRSGGALSVVENKANLDSLVASCFSEDAVRGEKSTEEVAEELVAESHNFEAADNLQLEMLQDAYPNRQYFEANCPKLLNELVQSKASFGSTTRVSSRRQSIARNVVQTTSAAQREQYSNFVQNVHTDKDLDAGIQDDMLNAMAAETIADLAASSEHRPSEHEEGIIREMYGRITASGAVDHEELLELLLTEGRRLQWELAAKQQGPKTKKTTPPTTGTSRFKASLQRAFPALSSERSQAIVRQLYSMVTSSGGADLDGMADVLFQEARKIMSAKDKTSSNSDDVARRKLLSKL